ncbi:hypothetical protein ASPACDRAFT_75102 [Aspergillus aculeatus ATCC 16872]|uniref:Uncharacterized protein n=1 Tax=Aspergillus aculeatus (strain ATCC 16872 / CBS 172.66 / WB 5094) TaxID=690307 RepID=A0A1L9X529_ASPA1|nr:uncharacterized protein ASPACDRAFT_75102 [Aspergillus aculeatus ATCC 16872]OJK03552.1 hypothetical protein ASPACDRAFT_75102 [Aspergillus aculeatus ATCC 16872]
MAFRLPPQVPRRRPSYSHSLPSPALDIPSPLSQLPEHESTEWVLFSPTQQPSSIARTHTTSTDRTPRTYARLSDFGSFGTATRSAVGPESEAEEDALDEPLDDDGTELDSLDDGLHAFRAPSLVHDDPGAPVTLPAHDGLGSFQASSETVQHQLWQHEQFNPHRRPDLQPRRRSSVQRQLDSITRDEEADVERERWQRIERWRMEQSRALLNEIEKATRRRRDSRASGPSGQAEQPISPAESLEVSQTPASSSTAEQETDNDESLWKRITRKVIQDLIGIDDSLLSVLFGESLPCTEDAEMHTSARSNSEFDFNEAINQELDSASDQSPPWKNKLLQRIARELGILVHQLCEHPGAFTTYLNLSHDIPNQYAGIPLERLPEEDNRLSASAEPATMIESTNNAESTLSPQFTPTLQVPDSREHAALWGIEDDDDLVRGSSGSAGDPSSESARIHQEREYWERELDVSVVFRYLRNRFSQRPNTTDSIHNTSHRPTQDASRRAAIIRQHHPLVARAHARSQAQIRRQSQYSSHHSGPTGVSSPVLRQRFRRPSSSCASQSAKMSAISSRRTMTGSSRNYWDIGGSIDSGSAVAPVAAGVGAWGDV